MAWHKTHEERPRRCTYVVDHGVYSYRDIAEVGGAFWTWTPDVTNDDVLPLQEGHSHKEEGKEGARKDGTDQDAEQSKSGNESDGKPDSGEQ